MTCSSQLRGSPTDALLLRITDQSQQLAIQAVITSKGWTARLRRSHEWPHWQASLHGSWVHRNDPFAMSSLLLDQILATASPFDDVFDGEWLPCGPTLERLPIWTHCGLRIDLEARCMGWQPLALRQAISDAEAVWNGTDDAAWDSDTVQR